jgi:hypothetical protein
VLDEIAVNTIHLRRPCGLRDCATARGTELGRQAAELECRSVARYQRCAALFGRVGSSFNHICHGSSSSGLKVLGESLV